MRTFSFTPGAGRPAVSAVAYAPAKGAAPRALLVWHHGLGEHIGRYEKSEFVLCFASCSRARYLSRRAALSQPLPQKNQNENQPSVFSDFAAAGIAVTAYDAPGHGTTQATAVAAGTAAPSDFGLIQDWRALVSYFQAFAAAAAGGGGGAGCGTAPPVAPVGTPLFLGGHSMGGLVATLAAAAWCGGGGGGANQLPPLPPTQAARPPLAGLVLSSAAVDVEWTPVLRLQAPLGGLLAAVAPRARLVPAVRPQDMSSDPATVEHYIK